MDFLNQGMLFLLTLFQSALGSYALAIIALTVAIRLVLWPLNTAQAKSMKAMQVLQPKLKALQEEHKADPARMQSELMKLYSENKFNPMAGCLPMLVQLPIFIGLYGALMSTDFMMKAGSESFGFIQQLNHTLHTNGGEPLDGRFSVLAKDRFAVTGDVQVVLKGRATPEPVKVSDLRITDPAKVLHVEPRPLIPGEPLTFSLSKETLDFTEAYLQRVSLIKVKVSDTTSKELETIALQPDAEHAVFTSQVPTTAAKIGVFNPQTYHFDVLAMIIVYGLLTWAYQRSMTAMTPAASTADNAMQAAMTKWMPFLFTGMMFLIPIPAGVMLYLLVTMIMMLVQNLWLAYREKATPGSTSLGSKPNQQVVTITPDKA